MYKHRNLPNSLEPVVQKWSKEKENFYIGPENIFYFKGKKINYLENPDIPLENGTWYAASNNYDFKKIPELSHKQIEDIAIELAKHFRPKRWSLTLDYRCNYNCTMCPFHGEGYHDSNDSGDYWKQRKSQRRVFPKEEAFMIIDIIHHNNVKQLNLGTVGELFLYPFWKDVALYASEKGMRLGTITNGSLIDEDMCKTMKEVGIKDVRISLDALTYKTYSKVRKTTERNFNAAINAPLLLKKYGFNVNIHFVRQQENIHEADDFLKLWKANSVDSISIANQLVYHDGVSSDKIVHSEYTKSKLNGKEEFIHGICAKYGNFITLLNGNVVGCCEMTALYKDGDNSLNLPVLNFKEHTFDNCVEELNNLMVRHDSSLLGVCKHCPLYTLFITEETFGEWVVYRSRERETWVRNHN